MQNGRDDAGRHSALFSVPTFHLMSLTPEQTRNLLFAHCYRVVNDMDADSLFDYAVRVMAESFDQNPGTGDTDVPFLISDIMTAEGGDADSAYEFIAEALDPETADELMATEF